MAREAERGREGERERGEGGGGGGVRNEEKEDGLKLLQTSTHYFSYILVDIVCMLSHMCVNLSVSINSSGKYISMYNNGSIRYPGQCPVC